MPPDVTAVVATESTLAFVLTIWHVATGCPLAKVPMVSQISVPVPVDKPDEMTMGDWTVKRSCVVPELPEIG